MSNFRNDVTYSRQFTSERATSGCFDAGIGSTIMKFVLAIETLEYKLLLKS